MRNSIEGFNQLEASKIQKTIIKNNKEVVIKLDVTDLVILRWFVDFSCTGKMRTTFIEGKPLYWVSYNKVMEDLPLLNIGKDMLYRRFKKMVDLDILTYSNEEKTVTYFGFGKNYELLITNTNSEGSEKIPSYSENNPSGYGKNSETGSENIPTNSNINNSSLDSSIKDIKKERKKEQTTQSYNLIIDENFSSDAVKNTLLEFIKMRKLIKKPLTDFALKKLCNNLKKLSTDDNEQIAILEQSIMNNWQGIFPLKKDNYYQVPIKQEDKPVEKNWFDI